MSQFGKVIMALRQKRGLTLDVMARKLGTHKGYVSGWITGAVNPPSPKILSKIARTFPEIALEDLVELAWVEKAPAVIRDRELARIQATNPLFGITVIPAVPQQVLIPKAAQAKEAV